MNREQLLICNQWPALTLTCSLPNPHVYRTIEHLLTCWSSTLSHDADLSWKVTPRMGWQFFLVKWVHFHLLWFHRTWLSWCLSEKLTVVTSDTSVTAMTVEERVMAPATNILYRPVAGPASHSHTGPESVSQVDGSRHNNQNRMRRN